MPTPSEGARCAGVRFGSKCEELNVRKSGPPCLTERTSPGALLLRRWAMCGRIWTPPDCNDWLDQDRRPQLLTYIRLLDAAGQRLRREPRWFSPASTSTAPRHRRKPCRSTHQVREATGVTVSPSPAICCNCRVRPPFLDCRFASGRLHRKRRLISRAACEHSPHDPRILVGKSHGHDIGMAPLPHLAEPEASRILLAISTA